VTVSLAEIGADRIDIDQDHVTNLADHCFEQIEIRLQVKCASALAVVGAHGGDDVHLAEVSAGGHESRHNGVGLAVFSA
jgi:hypothetical protein